MLRLVRSLKNSFAPISRIPPEVLSLIPDYYNTHFVDQGLITLTHVSHGWREMFISRSSLWTNLNFTNIERTRAYIQRSKSSPLNISIGNGGIEAYLNNVLPLVIPHIPGMKSLTIRTVITPDILRHFHFRAPLLERLDIENTSPDVQIFDNALFNGDLSPLRGLSLVGVTTDLPWTNMVNLAVFKLSCPRGHEVTVTQLLNFFESAPLLHTINITNSIPNSSDAPPERIVSLHHLTTLSIIAASTRPVFHHLHIPVGASLDVRTGLNRQSSLLPDYLLETPPNFKNLSNITMLNVNSIFARAQLVGPNGSLRLSLDLDPTLITLSDTGYRILCSLGQHILSTTRRLTISEYIHRGPPNFEAFFRSLSSMNDLRTFVLSNCNNQPFLIALNPERNPSKLVPCPNLKEIIFYGTRWCHTHSLVNTTKERALRGTKVSTVMMIGYGATVLEEEVLEIGEHVTHVECRANGSIPPWNYVPEGNGNG